MIRKVFFAASILIASFVLILALLIQLDLVSLPTQMFTRGSPTPSSPRFLFNIYGGEKRGENDLDGPLGVATYRGTVYVTDSKRGMIRVFNSKGSLLDSFGLKRKIRRVGKVVPGTNYLVGIAVGDKGKIYVSDMNSGKILIFNQKGAFQGFFQPSKKHKDILKKPLALAVYMGKIYVTDIGDQSIKIFNRNGELIRNFGEEGQGEGELSFPNGIVIAKDGTIFVADSNNSRVQAFDAQGKFRFSFKGESRFILPRGLAIDSLNRLHVADTLAHKILVFNSKGNFLFSYGSDKEFEDEEISESELLYPNGIDIDKKNRHIYITDKGSNRISVWEY